MADKVRDLRSALERLKTMEGQYIETDVEVQVEQSNVRQKKDQQWYLTMSKDIKMPE